MAQEARLARALADFVVCNDDVGRALTQGGYKGEGASLRANMVIVRVGPRGRITQYLVRSGIDSFVEFLGSCSSPRLAIL